MKRQTQNGKGSKRRPMDISRKEFEKNWDKIFSRNKKDKNEK